MPNPAGLHYAMAWSGFGRQHSSGKLEYRGRGIIRDARDVILMYVSEVNDMEALRSVAAFPPLHVTGPTKEQADQESEDLEFGPATIWASSNEVNVAPIAPQQLNGVVFQQLQETRSMIEQVLGSDVLSGVY